MSEERTRFQKFVEDRLVPYWKKNWVLYLIVSGMLGLLGMWFWYLYVAANPDTTITRPVVEQVEQQATRGAGRNVIAEPTQAAPPVETIFIDGYRSGYVQACFEVSLVYNPTPPQDFIRDRASENPDVTPDELVNMWRGFWDETCTQFAQKSIVGGQGKLWYEAWLERAE